MIPVFQYEINDGLAELVRSNASVAYTSIIDPKHLNTNQILDLQALLKASSQANPNQFDLFYLESVLASLGWNKNDDVFDKEPLWKARHTPVDKPFNFMHNEKDIIGHLTSSKVVDYDGSVIPDSVVLEQLPDNFEVVVGAVLYRNWSDATLQDRMSKIISEIAEGKWCVSMECMFRNFDYAVTNDQGVNKILARNDQTSFLTKHLRIYGGTGEYQGYRVGRVLRDFVFSGKGLVDNPANPRSHITSFNDKTETSSFVAANATLEELNISNEEKIMANEVSYTKEQYDALRAELDQFKSASQQATQKEIADLKVQIDDLTKANDTLNTELEASKEVSKAKEDKVLALENELTEAQTKLAEAEASIKEAEVKAVNASRKALLMDRVDETKAEELIQKFANASQEMFDALVDSLPKKSEDTEGKCADDKKKKDKGMAEDSEDEEDEEDSEAEVKTDLDDAAADEDADMSTGGTQEEETLRSKASAWFSANVLRTTHNK